MKSLLFKQFLYYLIVSCTVFSVSFAESIKLLLEPSNLVPFPRAGRINPDNSRRSFKGESIRLSAASGNLIPFPRVGRSSQLHNDPMDNYLPYPANSIDNYDDYSKLDMKRANLVAFPRVGRTNYNNNMRKSDMEQGLSGRSGSNAASPGLWFGPRLGKRNADDINETN